MQIVDRDYNGGGIMPPVKEDIPCKPLFVEFHPMEGFYLEINQFSPRKLETNFSFILITL